MVDLGKMTKEEIQELTLAIRSVQAKIMARHEQAPQEERALALYDLADFIRAIEVINDKASDTEPVDLDIPKE